MNLQQISLQIKGLLTCFFSQLFSPTFFHCFQVKRILYDEEEGSSDSSHPGSASSEDEDIFEETAQVTNIVVH